MLVRDPRRRVVGPLQEGMASTRATQRAAASTAATRALNLEHCDATQVQLLDEQCILVDERDTALGSCSKKDCHLMENINKGTTLVGKILRAQWEKKRRMADAGSPEIHFPCF
ncbi:hypothetical protein HPB48_007204 [Haemaphysalis longicornis]|uniref:Uncharacterized protein n=1 Tax=Haemaphysalis longicornis TaxID=44386 RepID=A0A9J6G1V9_HAELO|nr:hypothetical protein HPB48_007204 [Haemaphysalis longicornis]